MNFLDILSTCKWSKLVSSDKDKKPYSLPCSTFTNNFTGLTFVGQQSITKGQRSLAVISLICHFQEMLQFIRTQEPVAKYNTNVTRNS